MKIDYASLYQNCTFHDRQGRGLTAVCDHIGHKALMYIMYKYGFYIHWHKIETDVCIFKKTIKLYLQLNFITPQAWALAWGEGLFNMFKSYYFILYLLNCSFIYVPFDLSSFGDITAYNLINIKTRGHCIRNKQSFSSCMIVIWRYLTLYTWHVCDM